ncbi:MAG: cobalamin-dependent protein [Devosiaceae bacterium]|nr:cobalamin-dependent protein [Devosiaceae bacterium MH13]
MKKSQKRTGAQSLDAGAAAHEQISDDGFSTLAETNEGGLLAAIEGEIIPRLLLAHRQMSLDARLELSAATTASSALDGGQGGPREIAAGTVKEFARLLIAHDAPIAVGFVDMYLCSGVDVPTVLVELCAPTARELGDMWLRDECSFCEVTIALSSLEAVMLHCSQVDERRASWPEDDRSILLGLVPGNQHLFGLLVVKELFLRAGWVVRTPPANTASALVDMARRNSFTAIGLSVGSVDALPACQTLVHALRADSLNPRALIIVGGHGIQRATPETRALPVDLIARDGREGLDQLERMVARLNASQTVN